MKKSTPPILWFAAFILSMACFPALAAESPRAIVLPTEKAELKPGAGQERVFANCLPCHSVDYISMQPAFTKAQWAANVTKMIKVMGARISDDDARVITDYLAESYGTGK